MAMPDLFISSSGRDGVAIDILNNLFWEASEQGVSDIQLRFNQHLRTVRVEKVSDAVELFQPWGELDDRDLYEHIDARLRSRARIDAAARNTASDGRIRLRYRQEAGFSKNKTLDIRVSIIPTEAGQTYVCRIQDAKFSLKPLEDIAMSESVRRAFESLLEEKQGIVVVCGPTGSGKTTLLFSLLLEFLNLKRNIKTVEHPPEYIVDGFDQVAVSDQLSFADAIRAFMRQRPHVILVGEVRDPETAEAVSQAGNTGHIVFCTTHADHAPGVVKRFADLGMQRESIAQSFRLIIAQRLLDGVVEEYPDEDFKEPSELSRAWLKACGAYHPRDRFLELPRTHMKGRVPIFEAIQITPEVRAAIRNPEHRIMDIFEAAALQPQFETLAECAVRQARQGKTTLSEVHSLIGETVIQVHSERIDKVLVRDGVLDPEQAFQVVETQAKHRHNGRVISIWETVLELGLATLEQVIDAVGTTKEASNRLGYFRSQKLLSQPQLDAIDTAWKQTNCGESIFSIAESIGPLTHEDIYNKAVLYYRAPGMGALQ